LDFSNGEFFTTIIPDFFLPNGRIRSKILIQHLLVNGVRKVALIIVTPSRLVEGLSNATGYYFGLARIIPTPHGLRQYATRLIRLLPR
jgi:hypothetical protein